MSRRAQTAALCALMLALGAGAALVGARRDHRAPASAPAASGGPAELDRLAGVARTTLAGESADPAFAKNGPVTVGYTQQSNAYLGELTLWVACAGRGKITLSVLGVPGSESTSTERREQTRVSADCAADPIPARVTFVAAMAVDFIYRLIDSAGAAGRAGFAYRLTSSTGKLLTGATDEAYASTALHLTSDAGVGWGSHVVAGQTRESDVPLDGRYTVAAACVGTGTVYLRVRKHLFTVKCSWPAVRYDFKLERTVNAKTVFSLDYKSASAAPADVALQFIPR